MKKPAVIPASPADSASPKPAGKQESWKIRFPKPAEAPPGFRLVTGDEAAQEGDLYFDLYSGEWLENEILHLPPALPARMTNTALARRVKNEPQAKTTNPTTTNLMTPSPSLSPKRLKNTLLSDLERSQGRPNPHDPCPQIMGMPPQLRRFFDTGVAKECGYVVQGGPYRPADLELALSMANDLARPPCLGAVAPVKAGGTSYELLRHKSQLI